MNTLVSWTTRNAKSLTAGLVLALGWGLWAATRQPDRPFWLVTLVFAAMAWPIFASGAKYLWFSRKEVDIARARAANDVERTWEQEAAANAFWMVMGGLIFLDNVGRTFDIDWMAPITTIHVVVLGGLSFAVAYAWQKRVQG